METSGDNLTTESTEDSERIETQITISMIFAFSVVKNGDPI